MPLYKLSFGMAEDYELNVIASREEMEELVQTVRTMDCRTTGYDFHDASFMRIIPEQILTSTEHALWEIRRRLGEEKLEADLAEALAALPEQEQAEESEWLRAAVNHPVVTRVTERFQPAYRLAIQRLLAGLASPGRIGLEKDGRDRESGLVEHCRQAGADRAISCSAARAGSEPVHPNADDAAQ